MHEQVAREYLLRPDIALAEVAFVLGFSEQSAFARAFKRWTGTSPGALALARCPEVGTILDPR